MYPGKGHKNPSGLKPIISFVKESELPELLPLITGMKNTEIKTENKIIMIMKFLKIFDIKITLL